MEVRNQQVLLDRDVAALYGVETKKVNQAVKRNAERFYDGYILTLTPEECSRSQIVTLNGKRGSMEINFLIGKLKHTVRRVRKVNGSTAATEESR